MREEKHQEVSCRRRIKWREITYWIRHIGRMQSPEYEKDMACPICENTSFLQDLSCRIPEKVHSLPQQIWGLGMGIRPKAMIHSRTISRTTALVSPLSFLPTPFTYISWFSCVYSQVRSGQLFCKEIEAPVKIWDFWWGCWDPRVETSSFFH